MVEVVLPIVVVVESSGRGSAVNSRSGRQWKGVVVEVVLPIVEVVVSGRK